MRTNTTELNPAKHDKLFTVATITAIGIVALGACDQPAEKHDWPGVVTDHSIGITTIPIIENTYQITVQECEPDTTPANCVTEDIHVSLNNYQKYSIGTHLTVDDIRALE